MLAREHGLGLDDLFDKTYPYPTATRINKELAMEVLEDKQLGQNTTSFLRTVYRYNPF